MKISVLIIVHARPAHLRACLHALSLQTHPANQIVVVDDGSPCHYAEQIREIVSVCALPVELISHPRDAYCPAAARNEAVRHARHEYLLFYDCDVLAFPEGIERHLAASGPGTFLIGNCAPLPEAPSKRFLDSTDWNAGDLDRAWDQADIRTIRRAASTYRRQSIQRCIGCVSRHKPQLRSGHFSLYREDLLRVNGFDEAYKDWGYEDDDLGMRLYMSGLGSRSLITTARALHLYHPSAKQPVARKDKPNRTYFYRRQVAARCVNGIVSFCHE